MYSGNCERFEVLIAVVTKSSIFWDITQLTFSGLHGIIITEDITLHPRNYLQLYRTGTALTLICLPRLLRTTSMISLISLCPEHRTDLLMQCVDSITGVFFRDIFFIADAVPTKC
jgi:hypothetical protein